VTDRFLAIAPLPASSGRAGLALDMSGGIPRPVLLEFLPLEMEGDPDRLARLATEAEAAARLFHPNVLPPIGLETVGDDLALVRHWRDGVTLRAFLDAGGRLPPDLVARIGREACAALAHAHGRPGPEGRAVVHGILAPERILVAPDGGVLVGGFGAPPPGAQPADDVRALGAILYEALAGEPPGTPPRPLDIPGVPGPLAAAVDRAIAGGFPAAEPFAAALAETAPPAEPEALAVYAEAMVPSDEGDRAERSRLLEAAMASANTKVAPPLSAAAPADGGNDAEEITEEFIVGQLTPAPFQGPAAAALREPAPAPPEAVPDDLIVGEPTPAPVESTSPTVPAPAPLAEVAQTLAIPVPAGHRSLIPIAVAIAAAAAGLVIGLAIARGPLGSARSTTPASTATSSPSPSPTATAKSSSSPAAEAAPPPQPKPPGKPSLSVTAEPAGDVYVDGKKVGRAPVTVPVSRGVHTVRMRDATLGVDASRKVDVKGSATPVRFELGKGLLEVTAPDGAEVYLNGRRIGRGSLKYEVWEGEHRLEVRLGSAKAGERFRVAPNETWTYAVTPTP
jgi:eukaryotic-like serine/threonine-protein kinase